MGRSSWRPRARRRPTRTFFGSCANSFVPPKSSGQYFSQSRDGDLFSVVRLMHLIAFRCEAGFGSTDFSLCAFSATRKSKPQQAEACATHRAGTARWPHEMERARGYDKILARKFALLSAPRRAFRPVPHRVGCPGSCLVFYDTMCTGWGFCIFRSSSA